MICRDVRKALRRPGGSGLDEDVLRHATSCPDCRAEIRAALLLRLGSESEALERPGFEERLKARLASTPEAPRATTLNGGFEFLVRPALAAAAALTLLCAGLYIQVASPEPGGDLASLIDVDPVLDSLLGGTAEEILADAPGATEGP